MGRGGSKHRQSIPVFISVYTSYRAVFGCVTITLLSREFPTEQCGIRYSLSTLYTLAIT